MDTSDPRHYAVLIGIDRYRDERNLSPLRFAERDACQLRRVLAAAHSLFPAENIHLLTGEAASLRHVEEVLHDVLINRCDSRSTVLVYFAGHGFFAGTQHLPYLATHDVDIARLIKNPNVGLRMDRLQTDYFNVSPAGNVIFVMDGCHNGALTPAIARMGPDISRRRIVDHCLFTGCAGRTALYACSPVGVGRESAELESGVFTHYLIRALKGAAAEPPSGEVTLESLARYMVRHLPAAQPAEWCGRPMGRVILNRSGPRKNGDGPFHVAIDRDLQYGTAAAALTHPLDAHLGMVDAVVAAIRRELSRSDDFLEKRLLTALRTVCGAGVILLLRWDGGEWFVRSRSDFDAGIPGRDTYLKRAASRAFLAMEKFMEKEAAAGDQFFLFREADGNERAFMVTPLYRDRSARDRHECREYMVAYGLTPDAPHLSTLFRHIVSAVYMATGEMTSASAPLIEAAVLDRIGTAHRHLPSRIRNRRFRLFRERLDTISVAYEPIVFMEPGNIYICGWEALARDHLGAAPSDLFAAAELWGREFMTELDVHFLATALARYRKALNTANQNRPGDVLRLHVNVYPESLMREAYYRSLEESLIASGLPAHKLVLELSEKMATPKEAGDIAEFKKQLERYVRHLRIGFAIDDFGVGYSSVSRLANLNPSYVKVDREILFHDTWRTTLNYVLDITSHGRLNPPQVIIEGYDSTCPIPLSRLYRSGVRFVQGYLVGKATDRLYRLSKELVERLEQNLIRDLTGAPVNGNGF